MDEQLITKREKIGAYRTVAVSSSGFSNSAIVTAHRYGVELRQFDQISDAEIAREWAAGFAMSLIVTELFVLDMEIIDTDGQFVPADQIPPDLNIYTEFLRKKGEDGGLSAYDIGERAGHPPELTEDGPPVYATATLDFKNSDYFIDTMSGERVVSRVAVKFEFRQRRVPTPLKSVKQYISMEEPLMELVEGSAPMDDRRNVVIEASIKTNKPLPVTTIPRKRKRQDYEQTSGEN